LGGNIGGMFDHKAADGKIGGNSNDAHNKTMETEKNRKEKVCRQKTYLELPHMRSKKTHELMGGRKMVNVHSYVPEDIFSNSGESIHDLARK
jgi:hypothetical protein